MSQQTSTSYPAFWIKYFSRGGGKRGRQCSLAKNCGFCRKGIEAEFWLKVDYENILACEGIGISLSLPILYTESFKCLCDWTFWRVRPIVLMTLVILLVIYTSTCQEAGKLHGVFSLITPRWNIDLFSIHYFVWCWLIQVFLTGRFWYVLDTDISRFL